MTINEVREALDAIKRSTDDPEVAHGIEDALWSSVLVSIADGTAEDPLEMARLAVTTGEIRFSRWYA